MPAWVGWPWRRRGRVLLPVRRWEGIQGGKAGGSWNRRCWNPAGPQPAAHPPPPPALLWGPRWGGPSSGGHYTPLGSGGPEKSEDLSKQHTWALSLLLHLPVKALAGTDFLEASQPSWRDRLGPTVPPPEDKVSLQATMLWHVCGTLCQAGNTGVTCQTSVRRPQRFHVAPSAAGLAPEDHNWVFWAQLWTQGVRRIHYLGRIDSSLFFAPSHCPLTALLLHVSS